MESRTRNSMLNMISGISYQGVSAFFNIFIRKFFIKYIGIVYLGFDGFFANIIAMTSLLDLGVLTSASFFISKEVAQKNSKESILETYHSFNFIYKIIGVFMIFIGCIVCLNLKFFVQTNGYNLSFLQLIFILQFARTVSNFLLSTPRIAMQCLQKNYENVAIDMGCAFSFGIIKLIVILLYRNYVFYLIVVLLEIVASNLLIRIRFRKIFGQTNIKKSFSLSSIKKILNYSKKIAILNVSDFIYRSTDNLIIAYNSGMQVVGILSNYYYIFTTIDALYTQLYYSISASVTNFFHDESINSDVNKNNLFNLMSFLAYVFGAFCIIYLSILTEPFIALFFGSEYVYETSVIILFLINFFITVLHSPLTIYINAIGLANKQAVFSIFSTVINLFVSIFSYPYIGVSGVLMGTVLSNGLYYIFRLKIIKKYNEENYNYYKVRVRQYVVIYLTIIPLSIGIQAMFPQTWLTFLILIVIGMIVFAMMVFIFRKSVEFETLKVLVTKELSKMKLYKYKG